MAKAIVLFTITASIALAACNGQDASNTEAPETSATSAAVLPPCCEDTNTDVPDREDPWYVKRDLPSDLRTALDETRRYLGEDNVGFRMMGNASTCRAFRQAGLGCDFNTRVDVSHFLTVNGKGLFPAAGRTNPYVNSLIDEFGADAYYGEMQYGPDDVFHGGARQNKTLAAAVRKNAHLFKDGNITAETVKTRWQS